MINMLDEMLERPGWAKPYFERRPPKLFFHKDSCKISDLDLCLFSFSSGREGGGQKYDCTLCYLYVRTSIPLRQITMVEILDVCHSSWGSGGGIYP